MLENDKQKHTQTNMHTRGNNATLTKAVRVGYILENQALRVSA